MTFDALDPIERLIVESQEEFADLLAEELYGQFDMDLSVLEVFDILASCGLYLSKSDSANIASVAYFKRLKEKANELGSPTKPEE